MGKPLILENQVFHRLTVIEKTPKRKQCCIVWKCQCECGNIVEVTTIDLTHGRVKSCGCLSKKNRDRFAEQMRSDLTNERFGKLTVIERCLSKRGKRVVWHCKCDCGNFCDVVGRNLLEGNTKSCGCLKKEAYKKNIESARQGLLRIDGTEIHRISSNTIPSNSTTGIVGVAFCKGRNKPYFAYITFKSIRYRLGYYKTLEEAAKIRKEAEKRLYGEFLAWYREKYPKKI